MQDKRGYFYYRQYPWMKARTPMLHWGQATMFKALARLFRVLSQQEKLSETAATENHPGGERSRVIAGTT